MIENFCHIKRNIQEGGRGIVIERERKRERVRVFVCEKNKYKMGDS